MPIIKHIAIRTPDPEKTAEFYKRVFGMQEAGRAGSGFYLTDGYINLAVLKSTDSGSGESPRDIPGYAGIDHLGFLVEDVDGICQKLEEEGAKPMMDRVPVPPPTPGQSQSYYEIKYRGPDNQVIDISGAGWVGT